MIGVPFLTGAAAFLLAIGVLAFGHNLLAEAEGRPRWRVRRLPSDEFATELAVADAG